MKEIIVAEINYDIKEIFNTSKQSEKQSPALQKSRIVPITCKKQLKIDKLYTFQHEFSLLNMQNI